MDNLSDIVSEKNREPLKFRKETESKEGSCPWGRRKKEKERKRQDKQGLFNNLRVGTKKLNARHFAHHYLPTIPPGGHRVEMWRGYHALRRLCHEFLSLVMPAKCPMTTRKPAEADSHGPESTAGRGTASQDRFQWTVGSGSPVIRIAECPGRGNCVVRSRRVNIGVANSASGRFGRQDSPQKSRGPGLARPSDSARARSGSDMRSVCL